MPFVTANARAKKTASHKPIGQSSGAAAPSHHSGPSARTASPLGNVGGHLLPVDADAGPARAVRVRILDDAAGNPFALRMTLVVDRMLDTDVRAALVLRKHSRSLLEIERVVKHLVGGEIRTAVDSAPVGSFRHRPSFPNRGVAGDPPPQTPVSGLHN